MGTLKWQVELYKKGEAKVVGDWTGGVDLITTAYGIQATIGLAEKKDTFQFNIINNNKKFSNKFDIGDNVKIYSIRNGITTSVIDGIINEPPQTVDDGGRILLIKGTSRTEYLLSAIMYQPIKGPLKPNEIVGKVIDQVNSLNALGKTGLQITKGKIVSSKSDGSAFNPVTTIDIRNLSANQVLKRYSSDQYTKDKSYIYWIDFNNVFNWTYRTSTINASITEGSVATIEGSKIGPTQIKTNFPLDVINSVIISMGKTPRGRSIRVPDWDFVSVHKHGLRRKMITDFNNRGEELMKAEEEANSSNFDTKKNRFPLSYNTTDGINPSNGYITKWGATATDDESYEDAFQIKLKDEGKVHAKEVLGLFSKPRLKVQIEMPRNGGFNIGDFISVTSASNNLTSKNLRLTELTFSDSNTNLVLEEDITGTV